MFSNATTTMLVIASIESIVDTSILMFHARKMFAGTKNVNLDTQKLVSMGINENFS